MANCSDLFNGFLETISPSTTKKDNLKTARNAIRNIIKDYFKNEKKESQPNFYQQGSFALKTLVTPIDGEYDIDDGVYLKIFRKKKVNGLRLRQFMIGFIKQLMGIPKISP